MRSGLKIRWLAWPVIVALVALVALGGSTAKAQTENTMTAENVGVVALGNSFDVDVSISIVNTAYQGYGAFLSWNDAKLNYVADAGDPNLVPPGVAYLGLGGTSLDATPVVIDADTDTVADGVQFGSAKASGTSTATGAAATVTLQCVATGVDIPLHLVTLVEDPSFGTTTLGVGGSTITTILVDGKVTCAELSDIEVSKTHTPNPPVAGSLLTYSVTVHNAGPQAARGVVIVDVVPADKEVQGLVFDGTTYRLMPPAGGVDLTGDTVPDWPCSWYPLFPNPLPPYVPPTLNNVVLCYVAGASSPTMPAPLPSLAASQTVTLIVPVIPDLMSAGKQNINWGTSVLVGAPLVPEPNPTTDPNATNNDAYDAAVMAPATITATKVAPLQKLVGDSGQYVITVNSTGPSPASNVVLTDTLPVGVTGVSVTPSPDCAIVANVVTCNWALLAVPETKVVTINVTFNTAGTMTNTCTAEWSDPLTTNCPPVQTLVLPPFNGMVKDARPDLPGIQDAVSLWLCKEPNPDCGVLAWWGGPEIGKGALDVADLLFLREDTDSPNDSDTLPEGLAAYEEQLKYDHKIFDVSVADAGSDGIDNNGDTYIDEIDESVIAGWRGNINCTMTIMTENWIMFGCVSAGQALGNPMPVGEWLKTIHLEPDPDMFQRIRPTKDNGVVSTILDENCEVADIYASEPWPFTLPGGLTEDCTDLTVTVRMLEGDLNLDCEVNVLDQQAIAFRYSATFGLLLYDKFYDLEPKLTDFDIDIKDLQFVWGRDGSQCQAPIPNQPASPAIPDP